MTSEPCESQHSQLQSISQQSQKSRLSQLSDIIDDDTYGVINLSVPNLETVMTKLEDSGDGVDAYADTDADVGDADGEDEPEPVQKPILITNVRHNPDHGNDNVSPSQPPNSQFPIMDTLDEFPGRFNFQLSLNPLSKGCLYSPLLKKLFIDMDHKLPVKFKWEVDQNVQQNFQLRTYLVFNQDIYRTDTVRRCLNHKAPNLPTNLVCPPHVMDHVIRCDDPKAVYEDINNRVSIVTPIHSMIPFNFQFFCKNSCSSGMNRRETSIVFDLETKDCQIVGRQVMLIRICSCPKRDKIKEENEKRNPMRKNEQRLIAFSEKRKPAILGKRTYVQTENDYSVKIKVPYKRLKTLILESAFNTISGEAVRNNSYTLLLPYLNDIIRQLDP